MRQSEKLNLYEKQWPLHTFSAFWTAMGHDDDDDDGGGGGGELIWLLLFGAFNLSAYWHKERTHAIYTYRAIICILIASGCRFVCTIASSTVQNW